MATHSGILAWEILGTEKPGGPWGGKDMEMTECMCVRTHTHTHTHTTAGAIVVVTIAVMASNYWVIYMCLHPSNGEGNGTPLQCSCLESPMDGGAWWAAVHGVTTSRTQLGDFTFTFHFHALEKEMEPTPVFLPGKSHGLMILLGYSPWGSQRVGHDWATSLSLWYPSKPFRDNNFICII